MGTDWTLGWSLCTISNDSDLVEADQNGSMTVNLSADDGASYMAGLTLSGLAVLALAISY